MGHKGLKGKDNPMYGRKGPRSPRYGKKHSEETKKKIGESTSKALSGKSKTEEHNKKVSEALKGRVFTDEHKENISKASCGRKRPPCSQETRDKISELNKGEKNSMFGVKGSLHPRWSKKHTEETKAKMRKKKREFFGGLSKEEILTRSLPGRKAALRANPSSIEIAITQVLDSLNIEHETQVPIGKFIVDIYIPNYNLVIECDGDYWHSLPEIKERDVRKNEYLKDYGYALVRIPEHAIRENPQTALNEYCKNLLTVEV